MTRENSGFRGADLLVAALVRAGIQTVFGLPGDTGVDLYDALACRVGEISHVLARDERHAVAMADGFARAARSVGTVEVSSGGGLCYAIGGLGEAFAASVPVLVLASDIARASRGTGALTEIDQAALLAPVTKWLADAERPEDLGRLVAAALEAATSGRPAPVAVIVPEDVLAADVRGERREVPAYLAAGSARVPRERPPADADAVRAAAGRLLAAQRPCFVAGSGVHWSDAYDALGQLASAVGARVATTIHGKGAIADSAPGSLGVIGANGGTPEANSSVAAADLVLLVGTRANATDTDGWRSPPRSGVGVIQVDIEPERAGRNFPDAIGLAGDARTVLLQLLEAVLAAPGRDRLRRPWTEPAGAPAVGQPPAARTTPAGAPAVGQPPAAPTTPAGAPAVGQPPAAPTTPAGAPAVGQPPAARTERDGSAGGDRLRAADLVRCLQQAAGPDCLVVADPGTPTPTVAACWRQRTAGRRVLIPRGHGPMGYAIPAAIGVSLASGRQPVLALTTDGSLAMAAGELETAKRLGLPIVFVQLTNDSLGWIKMLQHLYMGRRYYEVDPGPIDAVLVATACGIPAVRTCDLDEVRRIVTGAIRERRAAYLEVPVRHLIEDAPPVAPWLAALAGQRDRPAY